MPRSILKFGSTSVIDPLTLLTTSGTPMTGLGPLATPTAPTLVGQTSGGSITAATYDVAITFTTVPGVNGAGSGETLPSVTGSATVATGSSGSILVTILSWPVTAGACNVYAGAHSGTLYKVTAISPVAYGTGSVTITAIPVSGTNPPVANTSWPNGLSSFYTTDVGSQVSVPIWLGTANTYGPGNGGIPSTAATLFEEGSGQYQFCEPNATYAVSGATTVAWTLGGVTSMQTAKWNQDLWQVNPQSTAFGLSLAKTTNITGFNDIAAPSGFEATTFPSGTVASTTNMTAGTVTTVTNLTNAPTAGDFTTAMKASLNAATPASLQAVTNIVTGGAITTSGGKVSEVALVDTLTTYTGNTPQTADSNVILSNGTYGNAALHTQIGTPATSTQAGTIISDLGTLATAVSAIPTDPLTSLGATAPVGWINTAAFASGATMPVVTSVTNPVTLPANPPAGFLVTASYSTAPAWYTAPSNPATVVLAANGFDNIVVETGVNARQALSPILAAAAGVLSGAGTGTITIDGGNVVTTRITATTDSAGNRSAVTLTLPT